MTSHGWFRINHPLFPLRWGLCFITTVFSNFSVNCWWGIQGPSAWHSNQWYYWWRHNRPKGRTRKAGLAWVVTPAQKPSPGYGYGVFRRTGPWVRWVFSEQHTVTVFLFLFTSDISSWFTLVKLLFGTEILNQICHEPTVSGVPWENTIYLAEMFHLLFSFHSF